MSLFLKHFNQLWILPLTFTTPSDFLCLVAVTRVSGSPERSIILPTKASGSTLRSTTPSTRPILRSTNPTASVWLDWTCGRLDTESDCHFDRLTQVHKLAFDLHFNYIHPRILLVIVCHCLFSVCAQLSFILNLFFSAKLILFIFPISNEQTLRCCESNKILFSQSVDLFDIWIKHLIVTHIYLFVCVAGQVWYHLW